MSSQSATSQKRLVFLLVVAGAVGAALVILFSGVFSPGVAQAQTSGCPQYSYQPGTMDPEVLVGTTATRLPALCARRGMAIQNRGADTIWCTTSGVAAHARVNRSWGIPAGGEWALDAKDTTGVFCLAEAAQTQGAATIVMELR